MNEIKNLKPFPKFCCSIGYIPTSYKISMTYEEQLLWLCDFLENTVIPTVNQNGQAVEELQNLFIELKNYVDNYFDNLDVQEEINNKLDEMAEDGTLEEIINKKFTTFPNFFLGQFFTSNNDPFNLCFFNSLDGLNWNKLNVPSINMRDASLKYNEENQTFYLLGIENNNIMLYYGNDLVNWQNTEIILNPSGVIYGPDLFIENNILYIVYSLQNGEEEDIHGTSIPKFDNYICKSNNIINNNNIVFEEANKISLINAPNNNYIDASLSKIGNNYFCVIKNEFNKHIELYSVPSLDSTFFYLINDNLTNSSLELEGPSLEISNNIVYCSCEMYNTQETIISKCSIDDFPNFNVWKKINSINDKMRHGNFININTDNSKKIITDINNFNFNENYNLQKNILRAYQFQISENYLYDNFAPQENYTYLIMKNETIQLSINNIFDIDYFTFRFNGNTNAKLIINSINNQELDNPIIINNSDLINNRELIKIPLKLNNYSNFNLNLHSLEKENTINNLENGWSLNSANFQKIDNIVQMALSLKCTVSNFANGHTTYNLLTLPDGYFPRMTTCCSLQIDGKSDIGSLYINSSNGKILGYIKANENDNLNITATYILH